MSVEMFAVLFAVAFCPEDLEDSTLGTDGLRQVLEVFPLADRVVEVGIAVRIAGFALHAEPVTDLQLLAFALEALVEMVVGTGDDLVGEVVGATRRHDAGSPAVGRLVAVGEDHDALEGGVDFLFADEAATAFAAEVEAIVTDVVVVALGLAVGRERAEVCGVEVCERNGLQAVEDVVADLVGADFRGLRVLDGGIVVIADRRVVEAVRVFFCHCGQQEEDHQDGLQPVDFPFEHGRCSFLVAVEVDGGDDLFEHDVVCFDFVSVEHELEDRTVLGERDIARTIGVVEDAFARADVDVSGSEAQGFDGGVDLLFVAVRLLAGVDLFLNVGLNQRLGVGIGSRLGAAELQAGERNGAVLFVDGLVVVDVLLDLAPPVGGVVADGGTRGLLGRRRHGVGGFADGGLGGVDLLVARGEAGDDAEHEDHSEHGQHDFGDFVHGFEDERLHGFLGHVF